MEATDKLEANNTRSSGKKDNDIIHDLLVLIKSIITGEAFASLKTKEDTLECNIDVSTYLPHLQIFYKNSLKIHKESYFSLTKQNRVSCVHPVNYEDSVNLKTLIKMESKNYLEQMMTIEDILQDLLLLIEVIMAGCAFISSLIIENGLLYRIDLSNFHFGVVLSYTDNIGNHRNDVSMLSKTNNNQNSLAEISCREPETKAELLSNTEVVQLHGIPRDMYIKRALSNDCSRDHNKEKPFLHTKYTEGKVLSEIPGAQMSIFHDPNTLISPKNKIENISLIRNNQRHLTVFNNNKIKLQTPSTERIYVCKYCDKTFNCAKTKRTHERIHTGERPYACNYCDKTFKTSSVKHVHERTHSCEKPYACNYCDKTFSSSSNKQVHERTHTGERPYACTICDKSFCTSTDKRRHERTHTGDITYACTYCQKTFRTSTGKQMHERTHTGKRLHACTYCDKTFSNYLKKQMHEVTHAGEKHTFESPYSTISCDKKLSTSSDKQTHEKTYTRESPCVSTFADKTFITTSDKKINKITHVGEKPHVCSYCHKTFTSNADMKKHERIHTGEKPFACIYCDKRFRQSGHLQRHQQIHSDEIPYTSTYCDETFKESSHLWKHQQII